MPLIHADTPTTTRAPHARAEPSVAVELEWALASGERRDWRADHPVLADIYDANPGLEQLVRDMWPEQMSCGGFLELMVVAHHGGLLFTDDAELLLGRLDELCAVAPTDPDVVGLLSESEEDRKVIVGRLRQLRRSGEVRKRYVHTVRTMWQAVSAEWERFGRPAVLAAVEARRRLQATGADWRQVVRADCDFGELLEQCVSVIAAAGGEVVAVPAFFTHKGLLIELPGTVVVGVRTDTSGAEARARTELLAKRLKTISDPTRLAILDALRSGPRTVTELAGSFSLAQPTVSNHVKLLRDAGLVTDVRHGTRRNLEVRTEVVDELLASLRDLLAPRALAAAEHGPVHP